MKVKFDTSLWYKPYFTQEVVFRRLVLMVKMLTRIQLPSELSVTRSILRSFPVDRLESSISGPTINENIFFMYLYVYR